MKRHDRRIYPPHGRPAAHGTRRRQAFTLIELLVVVSIITLLVGLLVPSLWRALELAKRAACSHSVKEIAKGCLAYADETRNHRGSTARSLPSVNPAGVDTNRNCLWLLIAYEHTSAQTLICPSLRKHKPAKRTDGKLTAETCGYSYISMVGRSDTGQNSQIRPVLSLSSPLVPGSLVVIGDLNPFNDPERSGADVSSANQNSLSHGRRDGFGEGQNIAGLDGHARWTEVAVAAPLRPDKGATPSSQPGWEWIYHAFGGGGNVMAGAPGDVLLIP